MASLVSQAREQQINDQSVAVPVSPMFGYVSDETEDADAGAACETDRMGAWSEVVDAGGRTRETDRRTEGLKIGTKSCNAGTDACGACEVLQRRH